MSFLSALWAAQAGWALRMEDPVTQKALISFIALVLIYGLLFVVAQILTRTVKDLRSRHKTRKFLYYLGAFLLALVLILIWSDFAGQFAIVISVIGAGLAIAFQQPLVSWLGWLYIIINRPYVIGDRIEIGGVAGDIIDIRVFRTILLEIGTPGVSRATQSTGRVIDIPNGLIFSNTLYNFTRGFEYLWNEYPIVITFESNWERAREILMEIVKKHTHQFELNARSQIEKMAERYMIEYGVLSGMIYVSIQESGVELALRFITPVRQSRLIRDAISRDVLKAFQQEPEIEIAYPTMRSFRRVDEEEKVERKKRRREE